MGEPSKKTRESGVSRERGQTKARKAGGKGEQEEFLNLLSSGGQGHGLSKEKWGLVTVRKNSSAGEKATRCSREIDLEWGWGVFDGRDNHT